MRGASRVRRRTCLAVLQSYAVMPVGAAPLRGRAVAVRNAVVVGEQVPPLQTFDVLDVGRDARLTRASTRCSSTAPPVVRPCRRKHGVVSCQTHEGKQYSRSATPVRAGRYRRLSLGMRPVTPPFGRLHGTRAGRTILRARHGRRAMLSPASAPAHAAGRPRSSRPTTYAPPDVPAPPSCPRHHACKARPRLPRHPVVPAPPSSPATAVVPAPRA